MKYFKRFKQSYKAVLNNKAYSISEHSFKRMVAIGLGKPFEWVNNYQCYGWLWMDGTTNHLTQSYKG